MVFFLVIFDPSPSWFYVFFFRETPPLPPKKTRGIFEKKVGIYRQAVYVTKEHCYNYSLLYFMK